MDDSELKEILLTLVTPNQNHLTLPSNVKGWSEQSEEPVCYWSGITCDPIDNSLIGLNLGNGFWTETLLGEAAAGPTFPSALGKIKTLRFINYRKSNSGPIPKSITDLPNLEIFDVTKNDIIGTFPDFQSDSLMVLDISKNRFYGAIPKHLFGHPEIGDDTAPYLKSIVKFDISHNGFNYTIPLNGDSGFYDKEAQTETVLKNLQYFDLGYNLLTGTIPNNIGNFASLQGLFLENNRLVGTIPKVLYRGSGIGANPLPLVQLFLQGNMLSGTLPSGLNEVFVNDEADHDLCDNVVCPANSISFEGVAPCTRCEEDGSDFRRYLGQRDKECRPKLSEVEILDLFFDHTHGEEWLDQRYFWEAGSPACQRPGIECRFVPSEFRFVDKLIDFDIKGNELQGGIPVLLCITEGINSNGVEDADGSQCVPCYDDEAQFFIGRDSCTDISIGMLQFRQDDIRHVAVYTTLALFTSAFIIHLVIMARRRKKYVLSENEDSSSQHQDPFPLQRQDSPLSVEDDEYEEYSDDDWTAADSETGTLAKKEGRDYSAIELADILPTIA
ncbi:leucine-rich repeat domain-containing protein [Skeletonema marinoi]|uniref:Leucine-rich repeat domain-containing protein n=1 Tax=Skeletonema marinoi TaxID=267567 RepID=A0AAD9D5D8_9STRA|nr:leucine-rich repeat domain-containing protein [Skeletonema marinoi]